MISQKDWLWHREGAEFYQDMQVLSNAHELLTLPGCLTTFQRQNKLLWIALKTRNSINSYFLFTQKTERGQLLHLEFVRLQRLMNMKASSKLLHTIMSYSSLVGTGLSQETMKVNFQCQI